MYRNFNNDQAPNEGPEPVPEVNCVNAPCGPAYFSGYRRDLVVSWEKHTTEELEVQSRPFCNHPGAFPNPRPRPFLDRAQGVQGGILPRVSWEYDSRTQYFSYYTRPQLPHNYIGQSRSGMEHSECFYNNRNQAEDFLMYRPPFQNYAIQPRQETRQITGYVTEGSSSLSKDCCEEMLDVPVLKGTNTEDFIAFQKERYIYEEKVEELSRTRNMNILPASYRSCIDDHHMEQLLTAGWIKGATSVNEVTEQQLKECIQRRARTDIADGIIHLNDILKVERYIQRVSMDFNIVDASERVWTLSMQYRMALAAAGHPYLFQTRPHVAIKHLMKLIRPALLRRKMREICEWRQDEGFDSKDYGAFVRQLAETAAELEGENPGLRARELLRENKHRDKRGHRNRRWGGSNKAGWG